MQEYRKIVISKDQIVPIAEKMRKEGRLLVMIHGFINEEGLMDVSWDYAVDPVVESYHVIGETTLPSIESIYDVAAAWPERELNELFALEFEGLDTENNRFLHLPRFRRFQRNRIVSWVSLLTLSSPEHP